MHKVLLLLGVVALAACAPAPPPVEAEPASPAYRDEALARLSSIEEKVVGLAEAVPDKSYTWRPGEGVRSVSEVYLHIAAANYGISEQLRHTAAGGFQLRRLRHADHRQGRDRGESQGLFRAHSGGHRKAERRTVRRSLEDVRSGYDHAASRLGLARASQRTYGSIDRLRPCKQGRAALESGRGIIHFRRCGRCTAYFYSPEAAGI